MQLCRDFLVTILRKGRIADRFFGSSRGKSQIFRFAEMNWIALSALVAFFVSRMPRGGRPRLVMKVRLRRQERPRETQSKLLVMLGLLVGVVCLPLPILGRGWR